MKKIIYSFVFVILVLSGCTPIAFNQKQVSKYLRLDDTVVRIIYPTDTSFSSFQLNDEEKINEIIHKDTKMTENAESVKKEILALQDVLKQSYIQFFENTTFEDSTRPESLPQSDQYFGLELTSNGKKYYVSAFHDGTIMFQDYVNNQKTYAKISDEDADALARILKEYMTKLVEIYEKNG